MPATIVRPTLICILLLLVLASATADRVRIVAANLSSGDNQSYLAPGERILQGLSPDIVLIQEFTIGSGTDQSVAGTNAWVAANFGAEFDWHREPGNEQIPNGVISRWPILASGEVANPTVGNRDTAWVRIDIPGATDLWAFSAHFITSPSSDQRVQAQNIRDFILANVPNGDYVVVGGDFNGVSALQDLGTVTVTAAPFPADQNGDDDTNANRNSQYDFVLVSAALEAQEAPVRLGSLSFANGCVFDTRVFPNQTALTAAAGPALLGDSGAANMQHMAVVRDFEVESAEPDYTISSTSLDHGTASACDGLTTATITLDVAMPFTLSAVTFSGVNAAEFSLVSPGLPAAISADTALVLGWTPAVNDGRPRNAAAAFTTTGTPGQFSIALTGTTQNDTGTEAGGGAPIDIGGWQLAQTASAQSFAFPANTILQPGDVAIVARDVDAAGFFAYWGTSQPAGVRFFRSGDALFPAINGDETFELRNGALVSQDGPTVAIASDENHQRINTSLSAGSPTSWTVGADDVGGGATPGVYAGIRTQSGRVIISEFSDADTFANEFVELFYDADGTTILPPAPPQGLIATPGDAIVTLDWPVNTEPEVDGYDVLRRAEGETPFTVIAAEVAASQHSDSTVQNGVTYEYRVRARAGSAVSCPGEIAQARPSGPPPEAAAHRHWIYY